MKKAHLRELAQNPDFISGIYNYCDRWCERCQSTSRCFLYATEQDDPDLADPETRDITNEKFWRKMQAIFAETAELIDQWAAEAGVDLDAVDTSEEVAEHNRQLDAAKNSEPGHASQEYAFAVREWFKKEIGEHEVARGEAGDDPTAAREEDLTIQNAIDVIHWYQFFIAAKTIRAMSGAEALDLETGEEYLPDLFMTDKSEEDDDFDFDEVIARADRMDANGSAKVALVGIDRSISAWRSLQMSLPAKTDAIKPMLIELKSMRRAVEARFPHARNFIRPGLDELDTKFVS
jgi:hypothetical protein